MKTYQRTYQRNHAYLTICACAILAACASPRYEHPSCDMPELNAQLVRLHDGTIKLIRAVPAKLEWTCEVIEVEKDVTKADFMDKYIGISYVKRQDRRIP